MKLTTLHWLLLVPLFAILLSDVCNGLVVDKDFLGEGKSLFVYGTKSYLATSAFVWILSPYLGLTYQVLHLASSATGGLVV